MSMAAARRVHDFLEARDKTPLRNMTITAGGISIGSSDLRELVRSEERHTLLSQQVTQTMEDVELIYETGVINKSQFEFFKGRLDAMVRNF